jgi:hypothetical protein
VLQRCGDSGSTRRGGTSQIPRCASGSPNRAEASTVTFVSEVRMARIIGEKCVFAATPRIAVDRSIAPSMLPVSSSLGGASKVRNFTLDYWMVELSGVEPPTS